MQVEVLEEVDENEHIEMHQFHAGNSNVQVVNLYVCRQSREEALKTYPLSFSVYYNQPLIAFNFESDTLLLGRRLKNPETFKQKCDQWDLAK